MSFQNFILNLCCCLPYKHASLVLAWCRFILTTYGIVIVGVFYIGGSVGLTIKDELDDGDTKNEDISFQVHIGSEDGDHFHFDDAFLMELMTNSIGKFDIFSELNLNFFFLLAITYVCYFLLIYFTSSLFATSLYIIGHSKVSYNF